MNQHIYRLPMDSLWTREEDKLESITTAITQLRGSNAVEIIELGNKLLMVKRLIPHGAYIDYVENTVRLSIRRAAYCVRVADIFNPYIYKGLGVKQLNLIAPSALYMLTGKSNKWVVEKAIDVINRNLPVTKTMVIAWKNQAIPPQSGRIPKKLRPIKKSAISSERELEDIILSNLPDKSVRQKVCNIGIADIVTDTAIYELKINVNANTLFKAVGQILLYRQAINPNLKAKLVISGIADSRINEMIELVRSIGIEVLLYE